MLSTEINTINTKEDVNADTQVLLSTIEGMMNVINTQASLYNDTRKRLVEEHLKKPSLEISKAESYYIESSYQGLGQKLGILNSRLRQLKEERENAQLQTEKAFKQLQDENSNLREEVTRLRNILYSTHSKNENI